MKGGVGGQAAAGSVLATGQLYRHPENRQSGLETGCLGQSVMSQRNTAARTQPQGPLSPENPVPPKAPPRRKTTHSPGPRVPAPMTLTDYLSAQFLK